MIPELVSVLHASGLIDDSTIRQFQRWGYIDPELMEVDPIDDPFKLARTIDSMLDRTEIRQTFLDVVWYYINTSSDGSIHMEAGSFDVKYGMDPLGAYILPWKGEVLENALLDGSTYLLDKDEKKVFFKNAEPLYYGRIISFMLCQPVGDQDV
jgi:hypothetical protein